MFQEITIPFGCVVLYNVLKLKPNVNDEDVELALGEMCNVVKNTYGYEKGGFIAGQVLKFSGDVSAQGTLSPPKDSLDNHLAIVTYWRTFDQHERSHADEIFKEKFGALAEMCTETLELGYEMLWQGAPEE